MLEDPATLIESLFAGVAEDPPWLGFLRRLETALPCAYATIVLRQPSAGDAGTMIAPGGDTEGSRTYREKYYDQSPLTLLEDGVAQTLHALHSEAELQAMAWYRDVILGFGTHDLIAVNIRDPASGMTLRLRGARRTDAPMFGESERAWLQRLVPALKGALALYAERVTRSVQIELHELAAGHLGVGTAILNEQAELIHANGLFQSILAAGDGLVQRGRRLGCCAADGDAAFQAAVRRVLDQGVGQHVIVRRQDDRLPWSVLVEPVRAGVKSDAGARPAVLLLLRGPSPAAGTPATLLRDLFGLTPAEAKLAMRLAGGDSLNDAAVALGVARNTVRAQLQAIFSKTGVARQADLVRLLIQATGHIWRP
jgi:DNA-binding CsgD family transcriptional regulator